jgi:hypothetical protein
LATGRSLAPGSKQGPRGAGSELLYVLGLQAFGTLYQREFHSLSLIERAETFTLYGSEVNKNIILAFLSGDETKSLGVVEPFDRTAVSITHTFSLGLTRFL